MRRPAISAATKIWVTNDYWSLYSQCCTWRPEGGVDVWECIRPHQSTVNTAPPNSLYWQYLGRR
ncbi:hypothetical protein EDD17DRAFT_1465677 [Pisolithus thermaeus]|nr:hypothetical protein EDD17DRAFT_1465677 [Pisolithus thermaeus]